MKKMLFGGLICVFLGGAVFGQGSAPWNEWSKKDADKVLNNSAWAQSIKKGESMPETMNRRAPTATQPSNTEGPPPLPTEVYLRVRLVSSKPIREGFANKILRSQPDAKPELQGQLQSAIDKGFGDFIVVAVNVDGQNAQTRGATLGALMKLKTADLVDKVYLERKDGKRLALVEYKTPVDDDMGGKFIFARSLDGNPFLTPDSDSFRFVINLSGNLKFNAKFDVSKMMYGQNLEY